MLEETSAPASAETATATDSATVDTGSTAAATNDWTAALDEETRATAAAKGWKSPADAAKAYLHSQRSFSELQQKALVPPGDDAKPEELDAFYAKLGRPEKPDGYEFKLPEGLPEAFPYDATMADKFKNWAHQAGIPSKQAQTLHDQYVKDIAAQMTAAQEAQAKVIEQSHEALVKAWGDPSSETYKRNQELANRALRQQGGSELIGELKSLGALGPNGEVKTPRLAQMLAKVGQELYAEDTLYAGPGNEPNPFSPKAENLTKQGEILRNDPARARVLIEKAGINPKEYGL